MREVKEPAINTEKMEERAINTRNGRTTDKYEERGTSK